MKPSLFFLLCPFLLLLAASPSPSRAQLQLGSFFHFLPIDETYVWNISCVPLVGCPNATLIFQVSPTQYLLDTRTATIALRSLAYDCLVDALAAPCPPSLLPSNSSLFGLPPSALPPNATGPALSVSLGARAVGRFPLPTSKNYTLSITPPAAQVGTQLQWWSGSVRVSLATPVPPAAVAVYALLGLALAALLLAAVLLRARLPVALAQYRVMMWKNAVLSVRNWGLSLLQILPSLAFVLFLLILAVVPHFTNPVNPDPPIRAIGPIPKCIRNPATHYCISLAFVPSSSPLVRQLMQTLSETSGLPLWYSLDTPANSLGNNKDNNNLNNNNLNNNSNIAPWGAIVGFESAQALTEYCLAHINTTQAGVVFNTLRPGTEQAAPSADYVIWYNNSYFQADAKLTVRYPDIRLPVQANVDSAIFQHLFANSSSQLALYTKKFPEVTLTDFLSDPVRIYGGMFFFCGALFPWVVLIYQLAYEKDHKLKLGMFMIGLRGSVYWLSWITTTLVFNLVCTLVLIASGCAAQFAFFLETNFLILLLLFCVFQASMMFLGIFISVFVSTVKQAISTSMLLFIVGSLIQMFCASPYFLAILYDPTSKIGYNFRQVLNFYPPFHFGKIFVDISLRSFSVGSSLHGPGYAWRDLYLPAPFPFQGVVLPPSILNIYWLIVDGLIFAILAWYFENVMTSGTGTAQPFWFPLSPKWWGCRRETRAPYEVLGEKPDDQPAALEDYLNAPVDQDVAAERMRAQHSEDDPSIAVRIVNLHKIYHKFPFQIPSKRDNHAVKGVSYCIERDSVFCLLGHNGSGKSTTIGMLTGLTKPSGDNGDAFVFGESVRLAPERVRQMIGVCPQHDILWPELTAYEHLWLFAQLRGIEKESIPAMIEDKLRSVSLLLVQDHQSQTFSGGMKRRLSVAISSIGDPPLIIMDEPTTGMDPKSVQHVWHMIQSLKKNRSILLTTHSMEEAEILADRIAIMNLGEIMCVGSALRLKNKFGDGYRLTVSVRPHAAQVVCEFFENVIPASKLISKTGDILIFSLPFDPQVDNSSITEPKESIEDSENPDLMKWLSLFEDFIQTHSDLILEWGVTMPTLEAVFQHVTDQKRIGK